MSNLVHKLRRKGAKHPKRLAAFIGKEKYGKKGMRKREIRGMHKARRMRRV